MKRIFACLVALLLVATCMLTACGGGDETTTTTTTAATTTTSSSTTSSSTTTSSSDTTPPPAEPAPFPTRPPIPAVPKINRVEIDSAEKLLQVANNIKNGNSYNGKFLYLTCDIVLNDISDDEWYLSPNVVEWPLGAMKTNDTSALFKGTFDGRGYSIIGLYSEFEKTEAGSYAMGLFPCVGGNVTIKNLALEDGYFKATNNFVKYKNDRWMGDGTLYAASFIGYSGGSYTVENCYSTCVFDVTSKSPVDEWWGSPLMVGGLTGYSYSGSGISTVKNCAFYGAVIAHLEELVFPADTQEPIVEGAVGAAPKVGLIAVGDWSWYHENTYINCIANASVDGTESVYAVVQAKRTSDSADAAINSYLVDIYANVTRQANLTGNTNFIISNCQAVSVDYSNAKDVTSAGFAWYEGGEMSEANCWYIGEDYWVLPVVFYCVDAQ